MLAVVIMTRCKYKRRVRFFYSKGAFLVLVWILLSSIANFSLARIIEKSLRYMAIQINAWIICIPFLLISIAAFVSGQLADVKYGKYPVIRVGFILLFTATVINCLFFLVFDIQAHTVALIVTSSVVTIIAIIGLVISTINMLQFGLDQMPDASSSSITSFIAWFLFCAVFGYWLIDQLDNLESKCVKSNLLSRLSYFDLWNLATATCFGLILITGSLWSEKWLIIEPPLSVKSLKTLYQVLKFSIKHRAPISRSALTYWEENIPSRLDLGKSKYGGPFTTEEVEDVKTTLRILVMSLSMWFVIVATQLNSQVVKIPSTLINTCVDPILKGFTYSSLWCLLTSTIVFEFVVYPIASRYVPTILKRVGILCFVSTIKTLLCLTLNIAQHYVQGYDLALEWTAAVIDSATDGLIDHALLTAIVEFIYAQSPYKMRGIFVAYFIVILILAVIISRLISSFLETAFVAQSVKTVFCAIGFLLHCIIANWYKGRERDEVYAVQRVVEEVYDRYLSQTVSQ